MNNYKKQFIENNTEAWMTVGAEYKARREALGLTITNVANNLGCSRDKVARFEQGLPIISANMMEFCYDMYLKMDAQDEKICEISNGYGATSEAIEASTAQYRELLRGYLAGIDTLTPIQRSVIEDLANDVADMTQQKTVEQLM